MTPSNLGELIAQLKQGRIAPRPAEPEPWDDMIRRLNESGRVHEVDEETFDYFLEVLPPRWMRGGTFAFGEGADVLKLFWQGHGEGFFVRQLTMDEHLRFCSLAQVPLSSG